MDSIYLWMIGLFVVVCLLDYLDRKDGPNGSWSPPVEHFNGGPAGSLSNIQERGMISYSMPQSHTDVNFTQKRLGYGVDSVDPPYLKCPMCSIQFDCTTYPYDINDKNETVCTTCKEKYVLNRNNFPVFARANGRPRQCVNSL